ncbi:class I SAM-dependent methyltransferase [Streptomyces sp. NPDC088124]|uniref:class I SAM-dependent methyltransferase n=1 Tax=Streptomyces sp. NPDC088124 TaxID=3154654 RepID=UPI003448F771
MNSFGRTRLSAEEWDLWWDNERTPRLVGDVEERKFCDQIGPASGTVAVDIGCGNGHWTRMHAVGYDFSPAAIDQARAAGTHSRLRYDLWDVEADSIPRGIRPGSIDVVTCRDSLAFLDRERFLTDVRRWLRPKSGALYVITKADSVDAEYQQSDPFERGLTQDEIDRLRDGWTYSTTYTVGPRTAVVLRGPA